MGKKKISQLIEKYFFSLFCEKQSFYIFLNTLAMEEMKYWFFCYR